VVVMTWLVSILGVSSLSSDLVTFEETGSVGELCPLDMSSAIWGRFERDINTLRSPSINHEL